MRTDECEYKHAGHARLLTADRLQTLHAIQRCHYYLNTVQKVQDNSKTLTDSSLDSTVCYSISWHGFDPITKMSSFFFFNAIRPLQGKELELEP